MTENIEPEPEDYDYDDNYDLNFDLSDFLADERVEALPEYINKGTEEVENDKRF